MRVSVVIPVYNAEQFVAAAIQSALAQPETAEILLIDDGSNDASRAICQKFLTEPRVQLLSHPNHLNQGASASRNLGIDKATMEYVAFLDADDTYVPDRFKNTGAIFREHPDADGVYETIGVQYHDASLKQRHIQRASGENTGIHILCPPESLFRILAMGKHGHISPDGLVLRREAVGSNFRFDSNLVLAEDSDFILRLAASIRLYGGDPGHIVALRGVHGKNSVFRNPHVMLYRNRYLQKCINHDFYGSNDVIACLYILTRRIGASKLYAPFKRLGKIALPIKLLFIGVYLVLRPKVLLNLARRVI